MLEITRECIKATPKKLGVAAYMRLYNEKNTLIECLLSIRGIFDQIVIAHQNSTDGTNSLIEDIKAKRVPGLEEERIEFHFYDENVIPPGVNKYGKPAYIPVPPIVQTMANYSNFALSKVSYEWAFKIDADQIYFNAPLKRMINTAMASGEIFYQSGINAYFIDGGVYTDVENSCNGWRDTIFAKTDAQFFINLPSHEHIPFAATAKPYNEPLWLHVQQFKRPALLRMITPVELFTWGRDPRMIFFSKGHPGRAIQEEGMCSFLDKERGFIEKTCQEFTKKLANKEKT